mmetsp:Transcript_10413/g.32962  ORF Transcript_10413/g.32962 Transcript_10413/m.32962 type:complete len:232 (-) Transcript_10413:213-908(-)
MSAASMPWHNSSTRETVGASGNRVATSRASRRTSSASCTSCWLKGGARMSDCTRRWTVDMDGSRVGLSSARVPGPTTLTSARRRAVASSEAGVTGGVGEVGRSPEVVSAVALHRSRSTATIPFGTVKNGPPCQASDDNGVPSARTLPTSFNEPPRSNGPSVLKGRGVDSVESPSSAGLCADNPCGRCSPSAEESRPPSLPAPRTVEPPLLALDKNKHRMGVAMRNCRSALT